MPYFHVVFTLPRPIADIAYPNKAVVYDLRQLRNSRSPVRPLGVYVWDPSPIRVAHIALARLQSIRMGRRLGDAALSAGIISAFARACACARWPEGISFAALVAEWSSRLVGLLSGAGGPYLLGLGSFGRGF